MANTAIEDHSTRYRFFGVLPAFGFLIFSHAFDGPDLLALNNP
jgi:hypothetical protein